MALPGFGAYGPGPGPDDPAGLRAGEAPLAGLAASAGKAESGEIGLPPRWGFERTPPGTQVRTPPNGRAFECDGQGHVLREPPGDG